MNKIDVSDTREMNEYLSGDQLARVTLPAETNLFLLNEPMESSYIDELERLAKNSRRTLICVDLGLLANKLVTQFADEELGRVVGVGGSGTSFAQRLLPGCKSIPVETVSFNREREKRVLSALPIVCDLAPVLIDDLVVSGETLRVAVEATSPKTMVAGTGMLYNSKTTKRRTTVPDLRTGMVYARLGGGVPPVNSFDTLRELPERCAELAERYFANSKAEFCGLVAVREKSSI